MSDLYICAIDHDAGSSVVTLGLYGALSRKVEKLGFLKPVGGNHDDHDVAVMQYAFGLKEDPGVLCPFCIKHARQQVAQETESDMLDVIDKTYRDISSRSDITLLQGISSLKPPNAFDININEAIAARLNVPVLLVARAIPENGVTDVTQVVAGARTALRSYENAGAKVAGVVVNRVVDQPVEIAFQRLRDGFDKAGIPYWGALPELQPLSCPRIDQIVEQLEADVVFGQEYMGNLVTRTVVAAMEPRNFFERLEDDRTLVVTAGDREEILLAISCAQLSQNHHTFSGVVLTGGIRPNGEMMQIIENLSPPAFPIISVNTDTFDTVKAILGVNTRIRPGDDDKLHIVNSAVLRHLHNEEILAALLKDKPKGKLAM